MSDYIKREDAIFVALQQPLYSVVSQIKQLEGIEIIRCKECKYYDNEDYGEPTRYCTWHESVVNADDYCSYGERKSDE